MSIFIFESEFLFYKILDCRFECFKTHLFQCKCLHLSRPIRNYTVPLPDKTSISVHSYGDIKLNDHIILKDVLFVPQFQVNLFLSVPLPPHHYLQSTAFPIIFLFRFSTAWGRLAWLRVVKISTSLIVTNYQCCIWRILFNQKVSQPLLTKFLQKFGIKDLVIFPIRFLVYWKIVFPKWNDNNPSYICPLAKQNDFFLFPTTFWPNILLIWFIVTYGALIMFLHTHKYFVNIMDDYTRFTWVFLLKWKCDATSIISYFFNMVATQFNSIIMSSIW